jgi:hypothetical protein
MLFYPRDRYIKTLKRGFGRNSNLSRTRVRVKCWPRWIIPPPPPGVLLESPPQPLRKFAGGSLPTIKLCGGMLIDRGVSLAGELLLSGRWNLGLGIQNPFRQLVCAISTPLPGFWLAGGALPSDPPIFLFFLIISPFQAVSSPTEPIRIKLENNLTEVDRQGISAN